VVGADQIVAADVSQARREVFAGMGVKAVEQAAEAARGARTLLLSVKPQQMGAVLEEIAPVVAGDVLVVSIAAGISTRYMEERMGDGSRVVRTMPNTPMLVGAGAVAIAAGGRATAEDLARVRRLFESSATVIEVEEGQLDAVTAVSGSGPAYFFYLVEQMVAAGVELGLTAEQAHVLAARTALGAGKMLAESGDSPQELRRKVTSPGGTTAAAISHLEQKQWDQITREALAAAKRRSEELGK
jgi:pyrroline-5-carboxylate reductase